MIRASKIAVTVLALFVAVSCLPRAARAAAECTVMGEVVRLKDSTAPEKKAESTVENAAEDGAGQAGEAAPGGVIVRLKEATGWQGEKNCQATGAAELARKNTAVSVSRDVSPRPTLAPGEIVFVTVSRPKGSLSPEIVLETFAPGEETLEGLMREAETYFDDRLRRLEILYAIKAYLGAPATVEQLSPLMDSDTDKERRLGAALLLILLAEDRQDVGGDVLRHAVDFALAQSRHATVGSSITLLPGARHQVVNELIGILHDKSAQDPYATIVALGELGPPAARALPDVIDRLDRPEAAAIRGDGDAIFASAVKKMRGGEVAAKVFLAKAGDGKLKTQAGPLEKGMCRLGPDGADLGAQGQALAQWCAAAKLVR
jgi:hypothetical protein